MAKKLEDLTEAEALAELERMRASAERNADQLSYKLAKEREEYKKDPADDTKAIIERTEKQLASTRNRELVLKFCIQKFREVDWTQPTDEYNGRRVNWTDPDGGEVHGARVMFYDEGDETFYLALDGGGEAEVPRTEVEFI